MRGRLSTAGLTVDIGCPDGWIARLLDRACAGELRPVPAGAGAVPSLRDPDPPQVRLTVERPAAPFHDASWHVVTRGAWSREGTLVLSDACSTGFDLALRLDGACLQVRARWRPRPANRAAARALPARFTLLARAALLQYPVLWRAGLEGRAPIHAVAVSADDGAVLLGGPAGVGKSTLVEGAVAGGAAATSDNLGVSDGRRVWGVVEPVRSENGTGARMPHGRREGPMRSRAECLTPGRLIVVELGDGLGGATALVPVDTDDGARALVTGTYMAGELRRFWPFAATLTAALGTGPAHPLVQQVSTGLASRTDCARLLVRRGDRRPLPKLLAGAAVVGEPVGGLR